MWSVGRLFRLLNLSWSQDVRKTPQDPPRPLQDASWVNFPKILGSNLAVFRSNLSDFRPPTWWIVQPTNKPNSQSTNQPTNQPKKTYIQTSLHPQARGRLGRRQLDIYVYNNMYICIYMYTYIYFFCIYQIAVGPHAHRPRDVGMSGCMVSLVGWLVGHLVS